MSEIGDRDRVDVIVTNPPFGGEEERGIQGNFPSDRQTAETALLFLQLIMRKLRRPGHGSDKGGRAGVVVPNGTLSGDGVAARIKQELIETFNLHTVVRLPNGVFSPYTLIPTNVLFFDRSGPTTETWYYQHPLTDGRKNYTKTRPLQFEEFSSLFEWWNERVESPQAWLVPVSQIQGNGYNFDLQNPRAPDPLEQRPPAELLKEMLANQEAIGTLMHQLSAELGSS